MRERFESEREFLNAREVLASLHLDVKLIRRQRRLLATKGWEAQPRAPAGQTDGGRWVADGRTGGPGGQPGALREGAPASEAPPAASTESTTLEDGTRVLSIRIRAGRKDFDAQHAVIAPDGESRIFETSGATQTIRDGGTGEVLSRSTFTSAALVPEATVQPAFLPAVPLAIEGALAALRAARTFELALSLFAALAARRDGFGTVLGLTAHEFRPGDQTSGGLIPWVGQLDQNALDAACPRNGEVQSIVDEVTARLKARGDYANPTELGTRIHVEIARIVNAPRDPNFVAELILADRKSNGARIMRGSKRADIFERSIPRTACIYDTKTGKQGLTWSDAVALIRAAQRHFVDVRRFIIIQVRPRT